MGDGKNALRRLTASDDGRGGRKKNKVSVKWVLFDVLPASPPAIANSTERKQGMISIAGLNKADVLAALYNASRPQGMGFLHYDPTPMTTQEAAALLEKYKYFDYLKGRVMKIGLDNGDELEERLYDRDNGPGAAEAALAALRSGDSAALSAAHEAGKLDAASKVLGEMGKPTTFDGGVMRLGMAEVAGDLAPAVARALGK